MSSNYKYVVEKKRNYVVFVMLPNNSNTQPIGKSKKYSDVETCLKGLQDFRKAAQQKDFSKHMIIKSSGGRWIPQIVIL